MVTSIFALRTRRDLGNNAGPDNLGCVVRKEERREHVLGAIKWSWDAYRSCAWGQDELQPMNCSGTEWFGLGLTLVDSLDTLILAGMDNVRASLGPALFLSFRAPCYAVLYCCRVPSDSATTTGENTISLAMCSMLPHAIMRLQAPCWRTLHIISRCMGRGHSCECINVLQLAVHCKVPLPPAILPAIPSVHWTCLCLSAMHTSHVYACSC